MRFTLAALVTMAVAASAVPTALLKREPGPSGSLISPAGQDPEVGGYEPYKIGDLITFEYQKARTDVAVTSALNVSLVTYEGRVTVNANNISLASFLSSPDDQDTITASFRIPQLVGLPVVPPQTSPQSSWVAHLQVYEYQTGSLGAAPFLAASPRIEIDQN